jgi:hypothetical protein
MVIKEKHFIGLFDDKVCLDVSGYHARGLDLSYYNARKFEGTVPTMDQMVEVRRDAVRYQILHPNNNVVITVHDAHVIPTNRRNASENVKDKYPLAPNNLYDWQPLTELDVRRITDSVRKEILEGKKEEKRAKKRR